MIYAIKGRFVQFTDSSIILEDGSGIFWEAEISDKSRAALSEAGEQATVLQIFTYLHHREDVMALYGFAESYEKDMFLMLMKVNGIGPKQAMKILSNCSVSALRAAIISEDETALTSLPGIGLKGAKKIILSLKDMMSVTSFASAGADATADGLGTVEEDQDQIIGHLSEALVQMGFDRRDVQKVLKTLSADSKLLAGPEGEILRRAIIELS